MTALALALSSYTFISGCGKNSTTIDNRDSTGTIAFELALPDGRQINTASYSITGPNGFMKSGTINVSQSNTLTATIGGLPVGMGFNITITAMTTDGSLSCGGSKTFNVSAGQTASVQVPLACHEAPRTGSVIVNGTLNVCPTIDGISANPAEANVGASIALSVAAHDSDAGPQALGYAWAASGAGAITAGANTPNPTVTCNTPGMATVTATVSDGDPAAGCAAQLSAQVNCTVADRTPGTYVAGDFHNHTTCSDGSISMEKLIKKATDTVETPWGLDWFVQAGHGGNGNRNCQLVEDASLATPVYPFISGVGPNTTWENSGVTPQGDVSGSTPNRNMWRWQSVQQFQYQVVEYFNVLKNIPLWIGLESVTAGHEHTSMGVITGQIPQALEGMMAPGAPNGTPLPPGSPYAAMGNANFLAQWEYCFDRADTDLSRGAANMYDCSVMGRPNAADPSWNATGHKLVPAGGAGTGDRGHQKTLEGLRWMNEKAPNESYFVPAHLERAGQFNPNGNNGFNVESLRDFNNAAPKVAFGMETQPGHGASSNRGEYQVLRQSINGVQTDSVGGTTFGGTGVYGGIVGGVWDAMLGEGRNFWFFASSDWHNRGNFGPDDRRSTQDFFPGEYQRNYTLVRNDGHKIRPQNVVDGLRTGNSFGTQGQLIDRLGFVACQNKSEGQVAQIASNGAINKTSLNVAGCATMGEKLQVASGTDVIVGIAVRDPAGTNFSPYTFANPSLAQIMRSVPLNMPVLDHIDLIGGTVTGYIDPTNTAAYAGAWPANFDWLRADGTTTGLGSVPPAAKNLSTAVLKTFNGAGATPWTKVTSFVDGTDFLVMTFRIPAAAASQYVRVRGTNMPPSVPFETDASGNPLADLYTNANDTTKLRIPCSVTPSSPNAFDGCPAHLATATSPATGDPNPIAGQKASSFDVAAWSDLWFYGNPIYIEVAGGVPVAGVQ
ncbi:MAG TPA: hypothetical protein VN903_27775 [Polyangia bacterium]|jgi:hypothetical protein|nr:hypothetical protein [Polyangia bacterium]